jgi:hypothetical protein
MSRGLLSGGAVQDFWTPIEAGRCVVVVAASEEEGREIDLTLSDDRGRRVGGPSPSGPVATLRACAEEAVTRRVRVHLEEGFGAFALQVFDQ